jgi:hypothetical protein
MKTDAFDDLHCPFNYQAELKKAREALNEKVGRFASDNPRMGYRELAKQFRISPGTLCAIAKRYSSKRKPGPRSRRITVTFEVRHCIGGKEYETAVTVVTARTGISVGSMRSSVADYYKTDDVSVGSGMKTDRRVEYDYDELCVLNTPITNLRKL